MTDRRTRLAILSSTAGFLQRGLQMAGTLVAIPLVLHKLGNEGFGIWAAAASLVWMSNVVDLGMGNAMLTTIAQAVGRGEMASARHQLTAALRLAAVIGVILAIGAIVVIHLAAPTRAGLAYMIAAVALAINIPGSLSTALWSGVQRLYIAWAWESLQTILTMSGFIGLTFFTKDPNIYVSLTVGAVVVTNCCSLLHFILRYPDLRPERSSFSWRLSASLLRKGAPYLLLGLSAALAMQADNIIALAVLGATDCARMALAQRAGMTAVNLLLVLTQPLWPAFTDAAARGDHGWMRSHIFGGAGVVVACAMAGSAVLVLFGHRLLGVWLGGSLTMGQGVLWAMAGWIIIPAVGRVPDVLLNALGVVWFQVAVALIFGILAFALKLALAPILGVAGIFAATAVSYATTHLPAYLWWTRRWLRSGGVSAIFATTPDAPR